MAYESLGRGFVSLFSFAIHQLPTTTKALGVELLVFCSVLFLCFFFSLDNNPHRCRVSLYLRPYLHPCPLPPFSPSGRQPTLPHPTLPLFYYNCNGICMYVKVKYVCMVCWAPKHRNMNEPTSRQKRRREKKTRLFMYICMRVCMDRR